MPSMSNWTLAIGFYWVVAGIWALGHMPDKFTSKLGWAAFVFLTGGFMLPAKLLHKVTE